MKHDQNDVFPYEQDALIDGLALLPKELSLEELLALLPEGAAQEELPGLIPDGLNAGGLLDWEASRRQRRMRLEAKINSDVQVYGFFVMVVFDPSRAQPPFAYTIGLHHTNPALCDLLMLGLDGERLQRFVSSIAQSALDGSLYEAGQTSAIFTANDLSFFFAPVEAEHYNDYLGWAINYYECQPFPVLQVVWLDEASHFPWQLGFDERFRVQQPLLFDQSKYSSRLSASLKEGNS